MMTNSVLINTHLGEAKGKPRVWIEGAHITKAGIEPGQILKVRFLAEQGTVEAFPSDDNFDHQVRVSKRTTRSGRVKPLLEIRHDKLLELFGINAKLRVVIRQGKLVIRLHHIDNKTEERVKRLKEKLLKGEPLTVGSLFHGGGTLDFAFHDGMSNSGIRTRTKVVNEIDKDFLSSSVENNQHLFDDETLFIHAPIESIDTSKSCQMDIILAGIPCTGASLSGRAKGKLKFSEAHETAGALFYSFLQFVQSSNAAIVLLENVSQYKSTASYAVIISVLETLGYNVNDAILHGNDYGALEGRKRLYMVATSKGLPELDFNQLVKPAKRYLAAADAFDPLPLDSDAWRTFPYLDDAEVKAKSKGNGFKRSYITHDSVTTPTIKRTNHKCQSDGVFIQHPINPTLSRLPTAKEHARFKTVPESLIEGLSESTACKILGQGIIHNVAMSVAQGIANQCLTHVAQLVRIAA
jgi:DNA (cytosine-5)-methyltransferase 1